MSKMGLSTMGPWLNTASGKQFFLLHPEESEVDPRDIAWALSMTCRFNGGTKEFYSVAQHCLIVSHMVPEEHALAGLLHDAAEAYIGDVTSPLKSILAEQYKPIETAIEARIFEHFGVSYPMDESVKVADQRAVATEIRDLMRPAKYWKPGSTPYPTVIVPANQLVSYFHWLDRLEDLAPWLDVGGGRNHLPLV